MTLIRGAGYDQARQAWVVPERYNAAVDSLDAHPDDGTAMIWADFTGATRFVSWAELRGMSHQFARILLDHGVRRGDVVAVLLPQVPEGAAALAGALRVGSVLLTISLSWGEQQILARLENSEPRVMITDRETLDLLGGPPPGVAHTVLLQDGLLDGVSTAPVRVETLADDPAHLYFTSGTSGPAKGLVHAQRSLIGHNEFEYSHALRPGDVFYGGGEWAWSHAKLFGPWRHGATQLVYRSERAFDAVGLVRVAAAHRAVSTLLSPTLIKLLQRDAAAEIDRLDWHWRTVCSSNEPLDPAVNDWFTGAFGVPVREYYGLTESYPMLGYAADEDVVRGSTGRPLPGWDVRLDTAGSADGAENSGEILMRAGSTPQYPLGYWQNAEAGEKAFGGEWFRTGDTFEVRDGYWHFIGRNNDIIKTAGYRVGPSEIEAVLESHPAVAAAGVIGVPDERRGEVVSAYVVLEGGAGDPDRLTPVLQDHVRSHHSRFAYPRTIVFVDELPRSTTGKVQRAALRAAHQRTIHESRIRPTEVPSA